MMKILKYNAIRTVTSGLNIITAMLLATPILSHAESYFNTQFLSDDPGAVADITRFIDSGSSVPPGTYTVDIYLNDSFVMTRDINFVYPEKSSAENNKTQKGLLPCLDNSWLTRFGVMVNDDTLKKETAGEKCLFITNVVPSSSTEFDVKKLRLNVNIPQAFLKGTERGYIPPEQWDEGINALLFNYNFNGDRSSYGDSYFLSLMSGMNLGAWRVRNNSSWSRYSSSEGSYSQWNNINTYLERDIIPLKGQFAAGDSDSGNDVFDSNSFRGIRFYSSDSMYPDSMQGYAPTVRGVAKTNAKVVVRQNGYTVYQTYVPPGPFELKDINPQMTSGNLEVTVEEKDGTVQKYVQPYSTVPVLQRENRVKYDVVVGRFRSGISEQDNPFYSQATLLYGLSHGYTLYGGSQMSNHYNSFALGLGVNIGEWGATSFDFTQSGTTLSDGSHRTGQSLRFLYAKSMETLGTTVRLLGYRYSTRGFYTLSDSTYKNMSGYDYSSLDNGPDGIKNTPSGYYNLRNTRKGNLQININQRLGDYGSVYITGSEQTYWNTNSKDRYYQAGYTSGWKGISYTLAWSYNQVRDMNTSERMLSFNVSVPLSLFSGGYSYKARAIDSMFATFSTNHSTSGGTQWNTGLGGTALPDRNLSYSISQGHSGQSGETGAINTNYRGTYGSSSLGYNYSQTYHSLNYGLSGGIIVHGNGITLGQPLGTTNVLIKAAGADGAKIQNQTGVKTDWRGYTYQPYATAYRNNRVALDLNSLDDHTDIQDNVRNVVPTKGAVVRADFHALRGYRALFNIKKDNGSPIPFGSMVSEADGRASGIISDNGQVYLNGLSEQGTLKVKWGSGNNESCSVSYALSADEIKQSIIRRNFTCDK